LIDLYFWPTGNGKKISIMLEETGLPYRVIPININKGDQFTPEFMAISPNNKMPAIVDSDSGLTIFESAPSCDRGKDGENCPPTRPAYRVLQWVFWQVGGLGPMAGQAHLSQVLAAEDRVRHAPLPAGGRAAVQGARHAARQDRVHRGRVFHRRHCRVAWVVRYEWQGQKLEDFPTSSAGSRPSAHGQRWRAARLSERI
jgi:GST-like protein